MEQKYKQVSLTKMLTKKQILEAWDIVQRHQIPVGHLRQVIIEPNREKIKSVAGEFDDLFMAYAMENILENISISELNELMKMEDT